MKARELMVGDLFRINKSGLCIVEDAIIKVTGINSENEATHCVDINDEDNNGGIWCEYLEPIALTSEILEKNGFMKGYRTIGLTNLPEFKLVNKQEKTNFERNLIKIRQSSDGLYDMQVGISSHIFDLKYVHELQHALRLCGIDKEIVL